MKKRLLVVGGVAAGPKAASKAKRCDPEMEVVIYQEEEEFSYAGCGLPYYVSGVIGKRKDLVSRTPEQFAQDGIQVHPQRRIEEIDPAKRVVSGRDLVSGEALTDHFDRLVLATGARAIRPEIEGIDLPNVFYLRDQPREGS